MTLEPELTSYFETRARTDYSIRPALVWASVASYSIWATLAIAAYTRPIPDNELSTLLSGLGLLGLLSSAPASYLVYLLVNRRNIHLAREEPLLAGIVRYLRSKTEPADLQTLLPIESAEYNLARFSTATKEHSAVLWALLTMIPYTGWVFLMFALTFLSRDFHAHEQREDLVLEDLGRTIVLRGGQAIPARQWRTPNPSVPLYIVLSVLSLGVFLFAWQYLAIDDPRTHFQHHQAVEPILAQLIPPPEPVGVSTA